MKRTKLEDYLSILQILFINRRPLKLSEIESATTIERAELEKALSFLLEQNAIEMRPFGASHAFFAAPLGAKLARYFGSHASLDR